MMMIMLLLMLDPHLLRGQARLMAESVQLFQRNNDVVNSLKEGINLATLSSSLDSPPVQILIALVVVLISAVWYALVRPSPAA